MLKPIDNQSDKEVERIREKRGWSHCSQQKEGCSQNGQNQSNSRIDEPNTFVKNKMKMYGCKQHIPAYVKDLSQPLIIDSNPKQKSLSIQKLKFALEADHTADKNYNESLMTQQNFLKKNRHLLADSYKQEEQSEKMKRKMFGANKIPSPKIDQIPDQGRSEKNKSAPMEMNMVRVQQKRKMIGAQQIIKPKIDHILEGQSLIQVPQSHPNERNFSKSEEKVQKSRKKMIGRKHMMSPKIDLVNESSEFVEKKESDKLTKPLNGKKESQIEIKRRMFGSLNSVNAKIDIIDGQSNKELKKTLKKSRHRIIGSVNKVSAETKILEEGDVSNMEKREESNKNEMKDLRNKKKIKVFGSRVSIKPQIDFSQGQPQNLGSLMHNSKDDFIAVEKKTEVEKLSQIGNEKSIREKRLIEEKRESEASIVSSNKKQNDYNINVVHVDDESDFRSSFTQKNENALRKQSQCLLEKDSSQEGAKHLEHSSEEHLIEGGEKQRCSQIKTSEETEKQEIQKPGNGELELAENAKEKKEEKECIGQENNETQRSEPDTQIIKYNELLNHNKVLNPSEIKETLKDDKKESKLVSSQQNNQKQDINEQNLELGEKKSQGQANNDLDSNKNSQVNDHNDKGKSVLEEKSDNEEDQEKKKCQSSFLLSGNIKSNSETAGKIEDLMMAEKSSHNFDLEEERSRYEVQILENNSIKNEYDYICHSIASKGSFTEEIQNQKQEIKEFESNGNEGSESHRGYLNLFYEERKSGEAMSHSFQTKDLGSEMSNSNRSKDSIKSKNIKISSKTNRTKLRKKTQENEKGNSEPIFEEKSNQGRKTLMTNDPLSQVSSNNSSKVVFHTKQLNNWKDQKIKKISVSKLKEENSKVASIKDSENFDIKLGETDKRTGKQHFEKSIKISPSAQNYLQRSIERNNKLKDIVSPYITPYLNSLKKSGKNQKIPKFGDHRKDEVKIQEGDRERGLDSEIERQERKKDNWTKNRRSKNPCEILNPVAESQFESLKREGVKSSCNKRSKDQTSGLKSSRRGSHSKKSIEGSESREVPMKKHEFLKAHSHQFSYLYPTKELNEDENNLNQKTKELEKKLKGKEGYGVDLRRKKESVKEVHKYIAEARREIMESQKFLQQLNT